MQNFEPARQGCYHKIRSVHLYKEILMSQFRYAMEENRDEEKQSGKLSTVEELRKIKRPDQGLSSDDIKNEEKLKGLVDEDHPFPSKGN
jgi:hypothetical protein